MREGGHIPAGEGRLLPGDRVEREARVGDDPRAVLARDGPVHLGAVRLAALAQDALRRRADLVLRLQRDALRLEAPMIDPRVDVELGQPRIREAPPSVRASVRAGRCGSTRAPWGRSRPHSPTASSA
jgi:hypothetical protein